MSTTIVWFRRDLRLADNPALDAAQRNGAHVLPVYVHAPEEEAPWQPGAASRWWLHHSLTALDAALRRRGSHLHVVHGPALAALRRIVAVTGAVAVHWNRLYEPAFVKRDAAIKRALRDDGIDAESHKAHVWFEPWEVLTAQGEPYRVFTPYWRNARARLVPLAPLPAPERVDSPATGEGVAVDALGLLPTLPWDGGFREAWTPGEQGAHAALDDFLGGPLAEYAVNRDRPDLEATSRLSPHLHFGEISPVQLVWSLEARMRDARANLREGAECFLRELGWREFAQQLLYHFPRMPEKNLDRRFDGFRWSNLDRVVLRRWQQGRTGIPIVDAGMRELWATGTMHNRVRMLVASFLTKNLRQHWKHGARWFWDTLVDADLANNAQGWQWTAGCGVDAAPYFRIFNPVTQGERFDPQGHYVRRWVPELAKAPVKIVHAPWRDPAWRAASGYPAPIVDLAGSRDLAMAAWRDRKA